MGAHSLAGTGSRRTATATAGLAVALLTTAATGLLTGGTALATEAHGGSGHGGSGHAHGHSDGWDDDAERTADPAEGFSAQDWCDVLGNVDLGDQDACDGSSGDGSSGDGSSFDAATARTAAATPAPAAPAPQPRPTSSVPDHPTVQPIVAPSGGARVVPIASGM
jgi:hypothetical protein